MYLNKTKIPKLNNNNNNNTMNFITYLESANYFTFVLKFKSILSIIINKNATALYYSA